MPRFPQPGQQVQSCCFPNCDAPVTDRVDLPLCGKHCLKVHAAVSAMLTVDIRTVLPAVPPPPRSKHKGYVYYVRMGDRVKIGHSLDPKQRLKVIPHEEVLLIIEGSASDEKAAHRRFAHLRTNGEWFRADSELLQYAQGPHRC